MSRLPTRATLVLLLARNVLLTMISEPKAPCVDINAPFNGTHFDFVGGSAHACELHKFGGQKAVLEKFSGRHVLFLGDSMTMYQTRSLMYDLHLGEMVLHRSFEHYGWYEFFAKFDTDLRPYGQCDCFRHLDMFGQALKPGIPLNFEVLYYFNQQYNFNVTYVWFSKIINGAHVPFGWKEDFKTPVQDMNVPGAPTFLLTPETFATQWLKDVGPVDDVILNMNGIWGHPKEEDGSFVTDLATYMKPFEKLLKPRSKLGQTWTPKPTFMTTCGQIPVGHEKFDEMYHRSFEYLSMPFKVCLADKTCTTLRNKTQEERQLVADLGWQLLDRAEVETKMFHIWKKNRFPWRAMYIDSFHHPWYVNNYYNEAVLQKLFEGWASADSIGSAGPHFRAEVPKALLYQFYNFDGTPVPLELGTYGTCDGVGQKLDMKNIASIQVSPGYQVTVYSECSNGQLGGVQDTLVGDKKMLLKLPAGGQGVVVTKLDTSKFVAKENRYYNALGENVGIWGGMCTCPDGQSYAVGDNQDACGSLACIGGTAGKCSSSPPKNAARMKVICAGNVDYALLAEAR